MTVSSSGSGDRPGVSSVGQAVAILRHLGTLADGAGVTAIARATGIGPSSCFNVLRTLVREDMVSFDTRTKLYRLGLGTIDLAHSALGRDALANAARAPMGRLAERLDAAIALWRLSDRERLTLISLAESGAATRIHLTMGQRQPVGTGAVGRALLATRRLSDSEIARLYAAVRWENPPGAEEYLRQVREAEVRGWAEDIGNNFHGVWTAGAAVVDRDGMARFVLSASIFGGRGSEDGMGRVGAELAQSARSLAATVYGTTDGREGAQGA